ncbi:hypothetical protein J2W88_002986 [Acidovorax delafieldii]|uniref:Uncharacterized protein n=1 Tax=Acidovorax delafieldii TaxID=47920 RepID=A0AAJ2BX54_ACIDE|nr:hypothetical protein [Acidovorax delafieldii]MDR6767705.1 hypothetical protein [Acidovorax delafieldii]MDR6839687.1 hypothetical protein [Acidovorax delafieldii]MDR7368412.1 hypothetical protein [Acidovorax delafieldii]
MSSTTAQQGSYKKSGDKRGDLFPPLQGAVSVFAIYRSQRIVVCRHGKGANADGAALLGLGYGDVELVIGCGVLHALDCQEPALGSFVALGLNGGLNSKRNGSSSCQSQTAQHHQVRPLAECRGRCGGAADKLNKVRREINSPIEPLASRVVPVPVLDIEEQIICHLEAHSQLTRSVLGRAVAAAVVDAPEALGFYAQVQCESFSWDAPLGRSCDVAFTTIATSGQPTNTEMGMA